MVQLFDVRVDDEGMFCGCGVVDMKGSLVSMIIVVECFVVDYFNYKGVISFLVISDEEGSVQYGIKVVVECLCERNECLDWCIVGESSSIILFGDVVKNGCCGFFRLYFDCVW